MRDSVPDVALDKTQSELKESDEFDYEDEMATEGEFEEHMGEIHAAFEVYATSILLARMFDDNRLTLGEYLDMMEHVEDYERELEASLM